MVEAQLTDLVGLRKGATVPSVGKAKYLRRESQLLPFARYSIVVFCQPSRFYFQSAYFPHRRHWSTALRAIIYFPNSDIFLYYSDFINSRMCCKSSCHTYLVNNIYKNTDKL